LRAATNAKAPRQALIANSLDFRSLRRGATSCIGSFGGGDFDDSEGSPLVRKGGAHHGPETTLRRIWSLGAAGVEVPLTLYREGVTFDVRVNSSDRAKFLKGPSLH